jgi:hypothetical protein
MTILIVNYLIAGAENNRSKMRNTLITWACGHFCSASAEACMSQKDIIDSATEDFWFLSQSADSDLNNSATEDHVACQTNCPKCQEPVSVSFWRNRAVEAIYTLRWLHCGSQQMYLETGAKYLALDFSQKAKYADHPKCAPAHQQFWISKTPRSEDPLFTRIDDILVLCERAEAILKTSMSHWEVKQAFVHINTARAHVGRIIGPFDDLLDGVELMAKVRSRKTENKFCSDGLPSRELMVTVPKAMDWFDRMEDWRDDAMQMMRDVLCAR